MATMVNISRSEDGTAIIPMDATPPAELLSYSLATILFIVVFCITAPTSAFGIFSNIVNIIIYTKMGLKKSMNIGFFALSIADLFGVLFNGMYSAFFLDYVYGHRMAISVLDILGATAQIQVIFVSFGSWTTTLINMERCCSVVFPFKVKRIFTPKVRAALFLGMMLYQIGAVIPALSTLQVIYAISPQTNRTRAFMYNDPTTYFISMVASLTAPSIICFFLVLVGTIFMVIKLRQSADWRMKSVADDSQKGSAKEDKLARTVIALCVVYIVCMTPGVVLVLTTLIYPDFNVINPSFYNLHMVTYTMGSTFQSISQSINIIIYYRMNTKYRKFFRALFCGEEKPKE